MMNRIAYLLPALLIMIAFNSCKKSNSTPAPATDLIVGTWTLQKDIITSYTNNIEVTDSTVMAADTEAASIQFNKDGSFNSQSFYYDRSNIAVSGSSAADTGKYTISGLSLYVSEMPVDFSFMLFRPTSGAWCDITFSNQVYSTTLKSLDAHNMNLVNQNTYTVTTSAGVVTNYKTVSDCYYTK